MPKPLLPLKVPDTIPLPSFALLSVTSRSGKGVYASSDTLFKGAIFGRDSLEIAEDLMYLKPRLVRNILQTLASLQGTVHNTHNEEEPGKIVHEYRNTVIDGKAIDATSLRIFKELSAKWGGNDREMAYYGSVDATPHFLRVLGRYCDFKGTEILDQTITLHSGGTATMREVAQCAAEWVLQKITTSKSGMVEFKKQNPHGIANQVWKDSEAFYVHENGKPVNHQFPVASIEVQALAYDGMLAAGALLANTAYARAAKTLRHTTLQTLWLPQRNNFALGLDYTATGDPRIIKTLTANQAALLDSHFLEDLPETDHQIYITGLVETIMSHDFLTDAGIRSRALSCAEVVSFWDYHGSYVSWAKETYDIAKGLRRHGFPLLARQLENRILNVCLRYKAYPEFVYVDGKGRVLASPPSSHTHGEFIFVEGTNKPERVQGWTVSAVMAIVSHRLKNRLSIKKPVTQGTWQADLEKKILATIPKVGRHISPSALKARYPEYVYKLRKDTQ